MNQPKVIAVVGTTASGKTDLAIELAKKFNGELVSVDSRQIYKEMNIGTNKDYRYPHHLMDLVTPDQVLTLADIQKLAFETIEDIIQRGKVPILVGGTGLYITAILENWKIPDEKGDPKYDALYIAPVIDREEVYEKINRRVDQMLEEGWLDEIKDLGEKYGWNTVAMTGHGYKQLGAYLRGETTLEKAIEETKKVIRHYAKRQLTWWRHHGDVNWVDGIGEAKKLVNIFL